MAVRTKTVKRSLRQPMDDDGDGNNFEHGDEIVHSRHADPSDYLVHQAVAGDDESDVVASEVEATNAGDDGSSATSVEVIGPLGPFLMCRDVDLDVQVGSLGLLMIFVQTFVDVPAVQKEEPQIQVQKYAADVVQPAKEEADGNGSSEPSEPAEPSGLPSSSL